jgi:hypothetical protein
MSITLELPPDLESKLTAEASRQGVTLTDYLLRILSRVGPTVGAIPSGKELVAYWESEGLLGARPDIDDSQQRARQLRADAERRERR